MISFFPSPQRFTRTLRLFPPIKVFPVSLFFTSFGLSFPFGWLVLRFLIPLQFIATSGSVHSIVLFHPKISAPPGVNLSLSLSPPCPPVVVFFFFRFDFQSLWRSVLGNAPLGEGDCLVCPSGFFSGRNLRHPRRKIQRPLSVFSPSVVSNPQFNYTIVPRLFGGKLAPGSLTLFGISLQTPYIFFFVTSPVKNPFILLFPHSPFSVPASYPLGFPVKRWSSPT